MSKFTPNGATRGGLRMTSTMLLQSQRHGLGRYCTAVQVYSSRVFSFESDALNAFRGMQSTMREEIRGRFVNGLPETYFDHALLWVLSGPLRRRYQPPKEGESAHPEALFPSWTWVVWAGEVSYMLTRLSSRILLTDFSTSEGERQLEKSQCIFREGEYDNGAILLCRR
jgi:hypothetical protein